MAKAVKTTTPKGLKPPASTGMLRGQPNKMSATDVPIEVPVFVYYERHFSEPKIGKSRGTGKPLSDLPPVPQLLGWTCTVEAFTYGQEVKVKVGHETGVLEVWIGDKKVHSQRRDPRFVGRQIPPHTLPRFDPDYKPKEGRLLIDHNQKIDDDPVFDDDDDFVEE